MKRYSTFYFIINLSSIAVALLCIKYGDLPDLLSTPSLPIIILLFIAIHIIRFIRMYFILLEDLIQPNRFVELYLKTTFVSAVIPYKIGELFKMYCFSIETASFLKGVVAVLIERFFDAIVMVVFMIPHAIETGTPSTLLTILSVFIIAILIIYCSFENTYRYLNNFLVRRGGGKKSLALLKSLEVAKKAYDSAKLIIRGRFILLVLLSIVAWSIESLMISIMETPEIHISETTIFNYINDGFFGITNAFSNNYALICAIIFIPILIIIYGKKYYKSLIRKATNEKNRNHI